MGDFISNLSTNILGVIIGGLIAYWIARWQFVTQEINEVRKNQVLLRENIVRVRKELSKNLGILKALCGVLEKSEISRSDILEWGMTFIESFSFFSFKHLTSSYLISLLPTPLERDIYDSYNELENIKNWYKQSAKAHNFYLGFYGSQEKANEEFNLIKRNANELRNKLESKLKRIEDFDLANT